MTRSILHPFRKITLAGGIAAAMAFTAQPALADDHAEGDAAMTEGEQELAKLLEGRVAGEPVNCISGMRSDRVRTIEETAFVYGRGKTIYVQRTRNPDHIDDNDIVVVQRTGGQLCRVDTMQTIDRYNGFLTGFHFLEDFIPYTRVDDSDG